MSTVLWRLAAGTVTGLVPIATFVWATPAQADCTSSGGVTVCAQGDARGSSGGGTGTAGSGYYPYPCEYDYYCNDWGVDVVLDVDPDLGKPGRPARPDNSLPGGGRGGGGRGGGRR